MDNELENENQPQEQTAETVKKIEKEKRSGYGFWIFLAVLFVAVLGFRVWWTNSFGGVEVDGASMNQTLQDGETLLMNFVEDGKGLERGDVIVVQVSHYPELKGTGVEYVIKRLIAVEGDKVRCTDGEIEICYAGTTEYVPFEDPYAYYGGMPGQDKYDYDFTEYTVGEGEIFFLGDNRLNSCDSRYKERGGSHLNGKLYKATDVYGVVPAWALEHREILATIFFR